MAKNKKIVFIPKNEHTRELEPSPEVIRKTVPKWFKNTGRFKSNSTEHNSYLEYAKSPDLPIFVTYKACIPFLDAMTSGYAIKLPATVMVTQNEKAPSFQWAVDWEILDSQDSLTFPNMPVPDGYSPYLFRWRNNWQVKTPPGYSLLITHPHNRFDLPFYTLSGIIDTDIHSNSIIMPFFVKEGFEGKIDIGTPIAQAIPIKRDSWESEVSDDYIDRFAVNRIKRYFIEGYKKHVWQKKNYG